MKTRTLAIALIFLASLPLFSNAPSFAQTPSSPSGSPAPAAETPPPQGLALLDELRRGGWTLFLALPELSPGQEGSQTPEWWKDCFTTLDISRKGIATAVRLGSSLRQLVLPFQEIRASEFCRSLNTVGAMGIIRRPAKTFAALNTLAAQKGAGKSPDEAAQAFKKLLDEPPTAGFNYLLVADIPDPAISPALATLAPGETALFKVTADKGATFVTRVTPDQWQALLAESEKARAAPDAPGKIVK